MLTRAKDVKFANASSILHLQSVFETLLNVNYGESNSRENVSNISNYTQ